MEDTSMHPDADTEMTPRLFISYSSKDGDFVERLVADLTSAKLNVWVDKKNIDIGYSIPGRISEGLATCDFYIIVLSPHAVASAWVKTELESAIMREIDDKDVRILPLLVRPCEIPTLLKQKRYLDFQRSYESGLLQLLDAVVETIDQRQLELRKEQQSPEQEAAFDKLAASLWANDDAFNGYTPSKSKDDCVILAPEGVPTVAVTVVFTSTGERYHVRLPLDVRCEIAARRIIGELYLSDLPMHRREAYLRRGDYYLGKPNGQSGTTEGPLTSFPFRSYASKPGFWSETLREAGIVDDDEIVVLSAIPYPWAHDVAFATVLMQQHQEQMLKSARYRMFSYTEGIIGERMRQGGI